MSACRQTHTHSTHTCHSIMPAALAFPAPSSTMQKGATDRHPHSRGAASYGHGGPWLHALPPCCKGTQVELEPNRSMAPSHEPHHHHRGRQTRLTRTPRPVGSPPEPHETARALRARLRPPHGPTRPARCRPGLQASGHGHARGRLAEGVSPVLLGAIGRSMALQTREARREPTSFANIYRIRRPRPPDVPAGKKKATGSTRGVSVVDTRGK